MALLTAQSITVSGLSPTYASAGGSGDTVAPGDDVFLHVKNAEGSPTTVTLVRPGTSYGVANPDPTVTVAATTGSQFIYLPREFADPTTGLVSITYSSVTSLTVAVLRV